MEQVPTVKSNYIESDRREKELVKMIYGLVQSEVDAEDEIVEKLGLTPAQRKFMNKLPSGSREMLIEYYDLHSESSDKSAGSLESRKLKKVEQLLDKEILTGQLIIDGRDLVFDESGIHNPKHLSLKLVQFLKESVSNNNYESRIREVFLLCADANGLKGCNELFGRLVGSELLVEILEGIENFLVEHEDLVILGTSYRSGDEFDSLVCGNISGQISEKLLKRLISQYLSKRDISKIFKSFLTSPDTVSRAKAAFVKFGLSEEYFDSNVWQKEITLSAGLGIRTLSSTLQRPQNEIEIKRLIKEGNLEKLCDYLISLMQTGAEFEGKEHKNYTKNEISKSSKVNSLILSYRETVQYLSEDEIESIKNLVRIGGDSLLREVSALFNLIVELNFLEQKSNSSNSDLIGKEKLRAKLKLILDLKKLETESRI